MTGRRWVRIVGAGLAYSGRCLLHNVIMWPDTAGDYATVYDGRDATSGKRFCRVGSDSAGMRPLSLGQGVPFDVGIYLAGNDDAVDTTVVFTPLE